MAKKARKQKFQHYETYFVKYTFINEEGFLKYAENEIRIIGANKNDHEKAEREAKKLFGHLKNFNLTHVIYC